MKVNVLLEFRFFVDEHNNIYTNSSFNQAFWQRYLMVFGKVQIIARAMKISSTDIKPDWQLVSNDNISFCAVPYYHGFVDLVKKLPRIISFFRKLPADDIYIFRMPSILAVVFYLSKRSVFKRPYGVEVVGDPDEVFKTLGSQYKWIGKKFIGLTKKIIRSAKAASYVEKGILPNKYPVANSNKFFFSSIDLPDSFYLDGIKKISEPRQPLQLISVGSLDQWYKGPDVLLAALKKCKEQGIDFRLTWLGGGKYYEEILDLAKQSGLQAMVNFAGVISDKKELVAYLDNSDLFVLASRTEGLPRAMIEAMARGLPCIGSRVGGIPQLLPEDHLFEKEDVEALAAYIISLANNRDALAGMSKQNILVARTYANSVLDKERERFYRSIFED